MIGQYFVFFLLFLELYFVLLLVLNCRTIKIIIIMQIYFLFILFIEL